jgi:hypothetical protein
MTEFWESNLYGFLSVIFCVLSLLPFRVANQRLSFPLSCGVFPLNPLGRAATAEYPSNSILIVRLVRHGKDHLVCLGRHIQARHPRLRLGGWFWELVLPLVPASLFVPLPSKRIALYIIASFASGPVRMPCSHAYCTRARTRLRAARWLSLSPLNSFG